MTLAMAMLTLIKKKKKKKEGNDNNTADECCHDSLKDRACKKKKEKKTQQQPNIISPLRFLVGGWCRPPEVTRPLNPPPFLLSPPPSCFG